MTMKSSSLMLREMEGNQCSFFFYACTSFISENTLPITTPNTCILNIITEFLILPKEKKALNNELACNIL